MENYKIKKVGLFFMASLLSMIYSHLLMADPMDKWTDWVLKDYPQINCPWQINPNQKRACVWPGKLSLAMSKDGGRFTYQVDVYEQQTFVALPGDAKYWPVDLVINGSTAKLLDRNGIPHISVSQGKHIINGRFRWSKQPSQLAVPDSIAIVELQVDGRNQAIDRRGGQLIFSNKSTEQQKKTNDSLSIDVYRLLSDGIPLTMTTRVQLSVSGKAREISFGSVMLADTEVIRIDSQMPARIEADGTMRAQVIPGEHTIDILTRFTRSPSTITTKKITDEWPAIEYLSFQSATAIRQAKLFGPASVDTTQISIPNAWAQYPTYRLTKEDGLSIETEYRGDHAPAANELNIDRDLWLAFDGKGITTFDRISGEMNQGWRLNTDNDTALGRATVDGAPVLITVDNGREGIEVRSPTIALEAITHTEKRSGFSVSGWDAQVNSYKATLHLPPGWRVMHASGVDRIWGTWLSQWDLWDVFLVLIIVSVTRKLMGNTVALLSGVTYLTALHEPGTPLLLIPVLLIIIALLPVLSGKLKTGLRNTGFIFAALLGILVIGFAVNTFRLAIYPSLERSAIGTYNHNNYQSQTLSSPVVQPMSLPMESVTFGQSENVRSRDSEPPMPPVAKMPKKSLYEVTENDRVQTGPGLPTWTWNAITLRASGPVAANQVMTIYYSTPLITTVWRVLAVLLVALYSGLTIARLFRLGHINKSSVNNSAAAILGAGLFLLVSASYSPESLSNEYPPQYLLEKLEKRLTEAPSCLPACVSLNQGLIAVMDNDLTIEFDVYTDAHIALPLPSGYDSWVLESVKAVDKNTGLDIALALKKEGDIRYVGLAKGQYRLTLKGQILDAQASIGLALPVHNIRVESPNWQVEGLIDGRARNNTLTLRTIEKGSSQQLDTLKADPAPVFARVIRHFNFGKKWTIETTVIRSPVEGAITLPVNLLPNERLLSDVGTVNQGKVSVQFDHRQQQISWTSSLEPSAELILEAPKNRTYIEEWAFTPSSLWRLQYEGIPPIKPDAYSHAFEPVFKPWPGETLKVMVGKPEGVPGPIHTVESAVLEIQAGSQLQRATLSLEIRSSLGADYNIVLPENSEILKLSVDGKVMNTPAENEITVPLQPRLQWVSLEFQSAVAMGVMNKSPQVLLPDGATNIKVNYRLPRDRWPLYLNGPAIGPAMLYWGVLLVIILGAIALPRLAASAKLSLPVNTLAWLLLGIGLSTVNSYGVLVIAVMFFVLAARKQYIDPLSFKPYQFNIIQIAIALWVIFSVLCMVMAIPMGLLSNPEMKVVGNGSSSHFYQYYQDATASADALPSVTIISVPILAYRIVMLLWSLWLSTHLIKWAIWAWQCFSAQTIWLSKNKKSETESKG